ncbi:MAG: hypothetical protein ACTHLR_02000 [Rhizomicrobium sp.]
MKEGFATGGHVGASQGGRFGEAVREVWKLLKQGIEFSMMREPKLQAEMRELAAPHMPLLVYKRAKVGATTGMLEDEQWFGELSDFVARMLWPYLQESAALNGRSKNCVAELLDEIVAAEQRSGADIALADIIPRTSRFDTSWAT